MSDQAMTLSVEDGLARLVFTNPERGNPMDRRFCAEIDLMAIELSTRPDVRAVLITSEGKSFSYGGDVDTFSEHLDDLPAEIKRLTTRLHSGMTRLQRMDAPIVVAVHGICAGGMNALVAGCDIVLASNTARFVAAYTGIAFSCDASTSITLTRRLGAGRARRFLILNEVIDAAQALADGFVDEVVEADKLIARAEAVARQLAEGPTRTYGEIRRLMLSTYDQPYETQLELEAQALSRIAATHDAREGLLAFSQRRKPQFIGR